MIRYLQLLSGVFRRTKKKGRTPVFCWLYAHCSVLTRSFLSSPSAPAFSDPCGLWYPRTLSVPQRFSDLPQAPSCSGSDAPDLPRNPWQPSGSGFPPSYFLFPLRGKWVFQQSDEGFCSHCPSASLYSPFSR